MKEVVKLKESQLRDIVRESIVSILSEKAKSKSQQRFFGMVDAYKKGELDDASPAVKKAADGMTNKEVKDFAKTKHKGLPNHVDESALANAIQESIKKVLNEDVCAWAVLDNEGEVIAQFTKRDDAYKFLEAEPHYAREIVPMGKNGYIMPYENADADEY